MDTGRFLEAGAAAHWAVRNEKLPIERRLNAITVYSLILGSSDPALGQRTIDAAIAEFTDKQGYESTRRDLRIQRALYVAMLREYDRAMDDITVSASANIAQAGGGWLEFQFPSLFWLAHLTGRRAPRKIVEFAQTLPSQSRGYRHSTALAKLMAESHDIDETARAIVGLADTVLTGRLFLGESEFLVAYARLAQLRGEPERALALLEYCAPRAPWTNIVMSEILGSIHGWSDEEWQELRSADITARADMAWLVQSREHMPARLADEIARWR
jgi:hypothetical protein